MNEKFRMLDLFSGKVSPVIIGFQGYPEVHSSSWSPQPTFYKTSS